MQMEVKMKNLKKKKKRGWLTSILFPGFTFTAVIAILIVGVFRFEAMSDMQNIDLLRQSTKKAMVQCYAIEGRYPPKIEYLEENYGLIYDHEKYYVEYDVFASNVMPNVDVFEKK